MDPHLLYELDGNVATLTLNRPAKLNTITAEMAREIGETAARINEDDEVRVVILTGEGKRAFCAGSDVKAMDAYGTTWQLRNRVEYCRTLLGITKPIIAAVRGHAIGGGLELALASDIRLAGESATFGAGEVKLGWHGGGGVTQLLPRIVGPGQAMRLMLTGEIINAEEALRIGLVQRVVPDVALPDSARELARTIAANAPIACRMIKEMVRVSLSTPLEAGLKYENDSFMLCWQSEDAQEGLRAFAEKRPPRFTGS